MNERIRQRASILKNNLTPYEKTAAIEVLRIVSGMSADDAYTAVTGMIADAKSCWSVPIDEELLMNNMKFYRFFRITDVYDPEEDDGAEASDSIPFDGADAALRALIANFISHNEYQKAVVVIRLLEDLQTVKDNV